MMVFMTVSTLIVVLAFVYILKYFFEYFQFRAKLRQFKQLKNIYLYLLNRDNEVALADFKLDRQVKVEAGWLYTKHFYFDLNDGKAISRVKDYFFEYYAYFLTEERWKGPELEKEVFSFGSLLESNKVLRFDSKKIQTVFRNVQFNSKNAVAA